MATLAEFMAKVVPWPQPGASGVINLHYTMPNHPGMAGRPFSQIGDFLAMVPWCLTHPGYVKDVYFCLSQQAQVGPMVNGRAKALRNAANSTYLTAIWLDVDVKDKGYASLDEALDAIIDFVAKTKLPPPSALVASGGGLQVYWFNKDPLTVAEWQPYAEGLKALAIREGLKCDAGLTTDCCRVLRVPGTFNFKYAPPRPVKILSLHAAYDFKVDLKLLPTIAPVLPHGNTPVGKAVTLLYDPKLFPPKTPITDPNESLAGGIATRDDTPLDFFSIVPECPFFTDAIMNGGRDHSQGLWHLSVLASTFCDNGEKIAHKLSNKYPAYTKDETRAMWDRKVAERATRGLGWPSCHAIEGEGSTFCAGCKHHGVIRSPLNLAKRVEPPAPPPPPAPLPQSQTVAPVDALTAADLPDGYLIDQKTGYVGFAATKSIGAGQTQDQFFPLFRCILYKGWAEKNPDALHFKASVDKGHIREVTILQEHMASTQGLCLTLAKQGVKFDPAQKEGLCGFMTYFLEKLHKEQEAVNAVPFGWWIDKGQVEGFAYAGHIFTRAGTVLPGGSGDMRTRNYYMPRGVIDPWARALKVITDQHRPEIEIIAAAAFASPLMRWTGQYSAILSAYSQSGSNKSTSVKVGLAVWGHPKSTKEVATTTPKSLMVKMGDIRNLPVYWDEIYEDAKMEKVGGTVCEATEGQGAGTLYQDRSQRERGSWQSCLVVCSNMSLFDHLIKRNKSNSAAINRILELEVPAATPLTPGRMDEDDAENLMMELEENYGNMGLKYSKVLASDPLAIKRFVKDVAIRFSDKVQKRDTERFWMALCSTIIAGAHLANLCGATFNTNEIEDCLVRAYLKMRKKLGDEPVIGSTYSHTTSVLTGFLKAYGGQNTIWTMDMPAAKAGKPKKISLQRGPDPRFTKAIHIQWVINNRLCRISKKEFYEYMHVNKYSPSMVMDGMKQHYNIHDPMPVINLCAGTEFQGGPEQLIVIPVPVKSWLEESMYAHTPIDQQNQPAPAPTGLTHSGQSVAAPAPSTPGAQQP